MDIFLDFLAITIICVLVIDVAGFARAIKTGLGKWLGRPADRITIKPFDCSLCSSWWCMCAYMCIYGQITLWHIALALCIACCSTIIGDLYIGMRDMLARIVGKIH